MVRLVLRGVGKTFIGTGVLILLFVAYQLWGTNLSEARAQRDLKAQFRQQLTPSTAAPATPGPATTAVVPPPPPEGEAVAIIEIPKIGLEKAVVEGVGVPDLKKGPGHYPGTPLPGQPGNAAIAGHRTTYGAPFNRIDELQPGDPILVTTREGTFRYEMAEQKIVSPSSVEVLDPTPDNRLTLTSCHPKFSARQRIIVVAKLVGEPGAPAPTTTSTTAPPGTPPSTPDTVAAGPEAGLSGERAARGPAVLWGAISAVVFLAIVLVGRRWRRWPAYLLGAPLFLAVLFVFFENVSRLLPANI